MKLRALDLAVPHGRGWCPTQGFHVTGVDLHLIAALLRGCLPSWPTQ